jgi:hypothetical protein
MTRRMDVSDDRKDIEDAFRALEDALTALEAGDREMFVFKIGYARGRLSRVSDRIYADPETDDGQAG